MNLVLGLDVSKGKSQDQAFLNKGEPYYKSFSVQYTLDGFLKSRKANPNDSLTFYWPLIGRQIKIRGTSFCMGKDQSSKDFLERGEVVRAIALQ